jgi:hypothetical protein
MSFNAFKARHSIAIPGPRYHTVIFVATNSDNSRFIHHVTGDLVTGMRYERKVGKISEESGTFYAPNDPREKMKKCTEWTEEQAIPALYASGVLLQNA